MMGVFLGSVVGGRMEGEGSRYAELDRFGPISRTAREVVIIVGVVGGW